ncbi:hypothetical protein [Pseudomonas boanensis]|uniref:hypothetical protein n=1 Tax=Metapseudomonas boanensis TaxID=2822138 RepID=UPI0035D474C7
MNRKSWWMATLMLASLPVTAGSLFDPVELSDAELAQLRGRYVLPDRIISFGVVMSSSWQNGSGQIVGAQVALNVASGQSQPSLTVNMINQAGAGGVVTAGTGQVIGGAGLNTVQGIVQSVRTAGDFNNGLNDVNVSVSTGGALQATPVGQAFTGSESFSNSAGAVQVSTANGGLQIALQAANGQGISTQQIGGGGVAQHANIGGSLNTVRNLAELNVALRDNTRNVNMTNCLEQLRSLRQGGY